MGATNSTPTIALPLFVDADKPTWRGDINASHHKIDDAFIADRSTIQSVHDELQLTIQSVRDDLQYYTPEAKAVIAAARNGVAVTNTASVNTLALNNLHTSAAALGLTIQLPAGNISVDVLNVETSMRGAGMFTTKLISSGMMTIAASNVTLEHLTIVSATPTAIIAANLTNINLCNIRVDFNASVLTDWLAFNPYNIDRLRVLHCQFRIGGLQLSLCDDFLIDGNYWDCEYMNTNEPCHISGQSSGQFVNNTVYRTLTDGVDLYSSGRRCVISNNRFYGLRGASGIECKVTMSDDAGNSSSPGNKFEATIISNNVLADFNALTTSSRTGIYAEFLDNRAAPSFSVAETNRAIIISGNVLETFNDVDPGTTISYWGITYTGHNGLIVNNVISNIKAWRGASTVGIKLAQPPIGARCVGTRIAGNIITGIEGGAGIETGDMDRCQIADNIVRGMEENGSQTRYGVSIIAGKTLNDCQIVNNTFECNYATGFGIRVGNTAATLNKVRVSGNTFRDCGLALGCSVQFCSFTDNILDNALNSQAFSIGVAGTSSRGNRFIGNHLTLSADYGMILTDHDGFVITSNTFYDTGRAVFLQGGTRNGVIDNNVSIKQALGIEFPYYSGVTAPDQATITIGANKVLVS